MNFNKNSNLIGLDVLSLDFENLDYKKINWPVDLSKYKIWAYENINLISENYFNGVAYPLKLSSKFGVYNEMIEIRANWDIEGIKITIMDNN